jgi:hypothetical protein
VSHTHGSNRKKINDETKDKMEILAPITHRHNNDVAKRHPSEPVLGLLSPVVLKREFMKSSKSKDNMEILPSLVSKHN